MMKLYERVVVVVDGIVAAAVVGDVVAVAYASVRDDSVVVVADVVLDYVLDETLPMATIADGNSARPDYTGTEHELILIQIHRKYSHFRITKKVLPNYLGSGPFEVPSCQRHICPV